MINNDTDQVKLSRKLHLLQTSQAVTMVGSFELDLNSKELLWTDAMFKLHGIPVTLGNKISLASAMQFVHPGEKESVESHLINTQSKDWIEFDFTIVTAGGESKILHAWCNYLEEIDGATVKRGSYQDITRQKNMEQELQAANEALRIKAEITEQAEVISKSGSYEWNMRTGELKYSDNLYRLFGLEPGQIAPSLDYFLSIVHPEDRERIEAQSKKVVYSDGISTSDYRIIINRKEVRHMHGRSRKIINSHGQAILLGSIRDVTDEQHTMHQLQERTLLAESISDHNVDLVAAYDTNLQIIWWNNQCESQYGLPKEKVMGQHILTIFPQLQGTEIETYLRDALKGEFIHIRERKSLIGDNYFESYLIPLTKDDKVYGVLSLTHDLTEIKAATDHLEQLNRQLQERTSLAETLIDTSIDAIAAYDTNLHIIAWNKMCEKRFRKERDEVIGKHVLEVFPTLARDERYQDMQEALKGKTFNYPIQYSRYSNSHYQSYLVPLLNDAHEIFAILSITHDVTELKQAAEKLAALNKSLEHKNKELEKTNNELVSFSYVASHDLQEPLRKIRTFSERLLEKELDHLSPSGKDYLKRMDNASMRMQNLIEDLLALSRTSTLPKNFENVPLNQILDEVRQNLSELMEEAQATLTADELPEANVIPIQFQQLLENLLINSMKYRKEGVPVQVHVSCNKLKANEVPFVPVEHVTAFYKITVRDNGIGFDQQYAEKIFEIFQRLHGKHEYSGTGIGLAICRKTMQNHMGHILAEGMPGEGAAFHIYLPVEQPSD